MKKLCLGLAGVLAFAAVAFAQAPERWVHIRVDGSGAKSEYVRVNVPMSVAEQVLPAIHSKDLNDGKVKIHGNVKDVDVRALLEAVAHSPDNEFVTVKSKDQDVRVAKAGEYLLVRVREKGEKSPQQVDVKIPMAVVRALLSDSQNTDELNVLAALKVLKSYGNVDLVTVTGKNETVRVWVDSSNTTNQ
jgi:hypothetical protein